MPIKTKDINEISKFILNHPISERVGLDYFSIPLKSKYCFYQEYEIEELLTDVSSDQHELLCKKVLNSKCGINKSEEDFGEIFIIPTERSKKLASNDVPKFEQDIIGFLSSQSDAKKGKIFEILTKYLFEKINIKLHDTPSSGDSGIDLYGSLLSKFPFGGSEYVFIQCKYYEGAVDVNVIKKVCADVLFNLMQPNCTVKHPVRPILVIKDKISTKGNELAGFFGVTIISLNQLIKKVAESSKLTFEDFQKYLG